MHGAAQAEVAARPPPTVNFRRLRRRHSAHHSTARLTLPRRAVSWGHQTQPGATRRKLERQSEVASHKTGRWPVCFCHDTKLRSRMLGSKVVRAVFERPDRE